MISLEMWKKRQALHYKARDFFLERGLLEVDVPILSAAGGTDPQIDYFETLASGNLQTLSSSNGSPNAACETVIQIANFEKPKYLSTSPEFFMKRLLAENYGDIFSLTRAFRKGESGLRHNSEFNIAEWYRVGFSVEKLQQEVLDLVNFICKKNLQLKRSTWEDVIKTAPIAEIQEEHPDWTLAEVEDYAMSVFVEPNLGKNCAEFIVDYPPERAALAKVKIDDSGKKTAARFELYINGIELCNGYEELTDAAEQKKRFLDDCELRNRMGKPVPKIDENFLLALEKGMPACSGVALGLDRLYMLALGLNNVKDILLFSDGDA